ncbi:MAG: 16S rRNA (guanine(527)-N(7))-methyltransferase RsmG [Pseudomonadota bacterium]
MLDELKAGLRLLNIEPSQRLCSTYLSYIELLIKWNKTYNLTAIKEPEAILYRHVLESLTVLNFIEGKHCIDIGTGAGLPGMILALALPETKWVLLDSNQKKTRFLIHVKAELSIENVEIIHDRVESYQAQNHFDTVICRAFAPLNRLIDLTQHLLTENNQLLAMKGKQAEDEIKELGQNEFSITLNNLAATTDSSHSKLVQIRQAE